MIKNDFSYGDRLIIENNGYHIEKAGHPTDDLLEKILYVLENNLPYVAMNPSDDRFATMTPLDLKKLAHLYEEDSNRVLRGRIDVLVSKKLNNFIADDFIDLRDYNKHVVISHNHSGYWFEEANEKPPQYLHLLLTSIESIVSLNLTREGTDSSSDEVKELLNLEQLAQQIIKRIKSSSRHDDLSFAEALEKSIKEKLSLSFKTSILDDIKAHLSDNRRCLFLAKKLNPQDKVNLLHLLVECDQLERLATLLRDNGDIEGRNERSETLLMHAAYRGNLKAVKLLLKLGATLFSTDETKGVFECACESGNLEMVDYLAKQGTWLIPRKERELFMNKELYSQEIVAYLLNR